MLINNLKHITIKGRSGKFKVYFILNEMIKLENIEFEKNLKNPTKIVPIF